LQLGVSACQFAILRYLHRAFSRPDSLLLYARPITWPLSSESGPTARIVPCGACLLVLPWQYAFAAAEPAAVYWASRWFSSCRAAWWETHQCRLNRHRHLLSLYFDGSATSLARIDLTDVGISGALHTGVSFFGLPTAAPPDPPCGKVCPGATSGRGGSFSMFRSAHRMI
jgi:hypothetical protein